MPVAFSMQSEKMKGQNIEDPFSETRRLASCIYTYIRI